jgi:hypothetical protein
MRGYNRVRGITWPVTFAVNGHRFVVLPPERGPNGPVVRCRVDGGSRAGDHEIGESYGEQTHGAIIGRTIRWWIEHTGFGASMDPRRDE